MPSVLFWLSAYIFNIMCIYIDVFNMLAINSATYSKKYIVLPFSFYYGLIFLNWCVFIILFLICIQFLSASYLNRYIGLPFSFYCGPIFVKRCVCIYIFDLSYATYYSLLIVVFMDIVIWYGSIVCGIFLSTP